MDRTINALRTSVVDDVHLCLRIADLLEGLTSKIRQRFIPFTPQNTFSPQLATRERPAYPTTQQQMPSPVQQANRPKIRYVRQQPQRGRPNQSGELPGPSYLGAPDSNITVMPPPRGVYNNSAYTTNSNNQYNSSSQPYEMQLQHQQQQRQTVPQQHAQQPYPLNSNSNDLNYGVPSEEDWLTLDLQPLLDGNGMATDADENWFGNAFGPETQNNLEVLGKLVNEGAWPSGQGVGEMGF